MDQEKILELAEQLDAYFNEQMSNEVQYNINCGFDVKEQLFHGVQWSLPSHIIVFLSCAIPQLKDKTLKLTPWP